MLRMDAHACWVQGVVAVHHPLEGAGVDVDEHAVDRDARADEGAGAGVADGFEDVLAFAGEQAEEIDEVVGELVAFDAEFLEAGGQFQDAGLADAAVGVAENDDLLAPLDGAGQGQGAHHGAGGAEDDVARVAQPDELGFGDAESVGQERIEPGIDAGEGDDGEGGGVLADVDDGVGLAADAAVVGVDDVFNQAHGWGWWAMFGGSASG